MTKPVLAFLGIGLMGAPMARNLLKAGYPLRVWNRTRAKAEALVPFGAVAAESAAAAAAGAEIVLTMLESGTVVEDLILGAGKVCEALPPGSLVIDMSSIEPARARAIAERLGEGGIGFLDAPVSGGTIGAEQASLAIMVGGDTQDFARAQPVFAAMGSATYVGPSGAGQLAKLCNQAIVAGTVTLIAEAMLLASAAGVDPAAVRAALKGGSADSKILQNQGGRMIDRNFMPTGTVGIVNKDCGNILAEARALGLTLPVSQRVGELFQQTVSHGKANYDHIGVLLELERINPGKRLGGGPDKTPA
jgi:2-hydroxy-3-oxopropionate reductase